MRYWSDVMKWTSKARKETFDCLLLRRECAAGVYAVDGVYSVYLEARSNLMQGKEAKHNTHDGRAMVKVYQLQERDGGSCPPPIADGKAEAIA
jgi:hypothetical protein